jgi:hypothetical protein
MGGLAARWRYRMATKYRKPIRSTGGMTMVKKQILEKLQGG